MGNKANKLAAIAMVKNEADIIESFARHVLCIVDVLLVTNHMSTDGTVDILRKLQVEGLPIRLGDFREAGQHQAQVMTGLLQRAVREEGADLVLALDGDEFPVALQGSSWLRTYLQGLDSSVVYQLPWVDYELKQPEKQQDKFLLARPAWRQRAANPLGKVMLGAEAVLRQQLSIEQGNHVAKPPELMGTMFGVATEPVAEGVHLAHFPRRSEAQQISKNLCMWLSNLSAFTEYTYYAMDYQPAFRAFVEGRTLRRTARGERQEAQLGAYKEECRLRYTSKEVRPIANVLRQAEQLAAEHGLWRALAGKPAVSVLLVWDGRREPFLASWQSVLAQSYLPQEIFVLDFAGQGTEAVQAEIGAAPLLTKVLSGEIFTQLEQLVRGGFVQWVLPGDVLLPDKLRDMTALLCAQQQTALAINVTEKRETGWAPGYLGIDADRLAYYFLGSKLRRALLQQGETCRSNLTGMLFRRELMTETHFLRGAFMEGRLLPLTLWSISLQDERMAALVQRPFVREAEHEWTADERILLEMEYFYLLEQAVAEGRLTEAETSAARGIFLARRKALLASGLAEGAESALAATYEQCLKQLT